MRNMLCLAVAGLFWTTSSAVAAAPAEKDIHKAIKTLLTAIQHGKDDLAAKQLAFEPMGALIMGDAWKDVSSGDRKTFLAGLETLIRRISFKKGRELFEHLDAVLYGPVRADGARTLCQATVVVHRNYKKQEVLIDFALVPEGNTWKVVDTIMVGESTAQGIHEDQVVPLMKQGGVAAVLAAIQKKVQELGG